MPCNCHSSTKAAGGPTDAELKAYRNFVQRNSINAAAQQRRASPEARGPSAKAPRPHMPRRKRIGHSKGLGYL